MERKLEDESTDGSNTNSDIIEKQIKETYILRNLDLESPQLNYEYLNEEIKIKDFSYIQKENYSPKKSFDQIKLVNRQIHQCNFKIKKIKETNLISIFDTHEDIQKCNFYLAEEITILTNIYMYVVDNIKQILPDHIILNQSDYTKQKYLDLMIKQDFPNMDYIIEYLQIADSKQIKRLVRDVPEEIINYKQFFEEVSNFNDLREILRALNLTESRKLIIYISNVIKYFQYIVNYYNTNLHNKEGMEGNYYTRNIPKLIDVNDEFSSEEQKVFLQEGKDIIKKQDNVDLQQQIKPDKKKFNVYNDVELEEFLDRYIQQCQQKEKKYEILKQQQYKVDEVLKDSQIQNKDSRQNDDQVSIKDFENIVTPTKYLNDVNMALLNTLPVNMASSNNQKKGKERLTKREKKELKKLQQKQRKAQKNKNNINKQAMNNLTEQKINNDIKNQDTQKEQIQNNIQKQTQDQEKNILMNNTLLQLN